MTDIIQTEVPAVKTSWLKKRSKWFTKKRLKWIIPTVIVALIVAAKVFGKNTAPTDVQTEVVQPQTIEQTVLSTGQVTSSVDLDLSFTTGGKVAKVNVKEGDVVKAGRVLATLNQDSARASLTSASGAVAQARANYDRVLAGSSDAQVTVSQAAVNTAQTSLDNAKRTYAQTDAQQTLLVENARKTMMNTGLQAEPGFLTSADAIAPTISGTYTGTEPATYMIDIYAAGGSPYYEVRGSNVQPGPVRVNVPIALDDKGLYFQFPANGVYDDQDQWVVNVPNTHAPTYLTYKTAYDAAVQSRVAALTSAQNNVDSAQSALAQANANLQQTLAKATSADVKAAQAQITSAQGQYLAAQAAYNATVITAPLDGTITSVTIRVGELATAMSTAIVLQNVADLHAEANVSEANVASLVIGQEVDYTFDALGPDEHYKGVIVSINPASTVVSGVVNYKITASIENIPAVKPGMTANITVSVAKKENVFAVPARAIIKEDGQDKVRVITDSKKKTFTSVAVTTGLHADGGLVEITSGLQAGQEIVTYAK